MGEGRHSMGSTLVQEAQEVSLASTRLTTSPYLSIEECHALEQVTTVGRSVPAGVDLSSEGDRNDLFRIIRDGWACRYKTTREGTRHIVRLLLPGDVADLDSLLLGRAGYSVRTLTAATIFTIPRDRVIALADRHSGIIKTLAWLAMSENAALSQATLRLGRQTAKQRLAHFLCELSVRLGSTARDRASYFDLPMTQEQIADTLGLTGVHVNRTLRSLSTEGLIEIRKRAIGITDVAALRRFAEFNPAYLHDAREVAAIGSHQRATDDVPQAIFAFPAA